MMDYDLKTFTLFRVFGCKIKISCIFTLNRFFLINKTSHLLKFSNSDSNSDSDFSFFQESLHLNSCTCFRCGYLMSDPPSI